MGRYLSILLALLTFGWASPALADVQLSFHSFNGSVLFGRYPHAFIVLEGELESSGEVINENYGFTAKTVSTRILNEGFRLRTKKQRILWVKLGLLA